MSTGSINGVPVMDHRAAVLAQQASDVLSMAAEDHPARDSLRRAASECLERARLLLGHVDRDSGADDEGDVAAVGLDFAQPSVAVEAFEHVLGVLGGHGELLASVVENELRHGDSSTSRGLDPPDETTVEGAGRPGSPPRPDASQQPRTPLHPALLDELAIIVQEAISLPTSDEPATAIATIRHASYTLWRILGTDTACPRITHFNGHLSDRYAAQRRVLGVLASLPAGEDGAS